MVNYYLQCKKCGGQASFDSIHSYEESIQFGCDRCRKEKYPKYVCVFDEEKNQWWVSKTRTRTAPDSKFLWFKIKGFEYVSAEPMKEGGEVLYFKTLQEAKDCVKDDFGDFYYDSRTTY